MKKIIADMHCHTLATSHAYSTILENVKSAKDNDIKLIAITEHGPAMSDSPHKAYFFKLNVLPRVIDDVVVLKGIEANILDYEGNVDIPIEFINELEWVIASMHDCVLASGTKDDHTKAWLGVCKNKYIDVIGHSGAELFKFDYEKVIQEFKIYNKIVEINASSSTVREGSKINCREIAKLCKKYEVPVVINSDAHFAPCIGKVDSATHMLSEIDFPEKLILNNDFEKLRKEIKRIRKKDILGDCKIQD